MPSKLVGCPTFGGPNLTDIFITSSSIYLDFYTGKSVDTEVDTKSDCNKGAVVTNVPEDGSLLKIEQTKLKGIAANSVYML